ncbi:MAG: NAD-dependent epimerase/dehydratase family protein [Alphaproteobacteria bacterium]|nr:NAD-dependent epimerase/dehydratase family protein [Alphaproteobacteria bacterium]
MSETLRGKRVAVTGASGFIGRRLSRVLMDEAGAAVVAVTRGGGVEAGARAAHAALGDEAGLRRALDGCHAVFHLAYEFGATRAALLGGFETLLRACAAAGVARFVQFSSIAVYDDWPGGDLTEDSACDAPGILYKRVKRAMELTLADSALTHAILQPTIVYGPRSPQWSARLLHQFRTGAVILPDGEDGLCHAVYVGDVAGAAIAAAERAPNGARYIVSGQTPVPWRTFYAAHAEIVGAPAPRLAPMETPPPPPPEEDAAPPGPLSGLARVARRSLGETAVQDIRATLQRLKSRGKAEHWPAPHEIRLLRARGSCSIARLRNDLGYAPRVDFAEGMAWIAEDWRSRGRG